jgi:hypothetical protein
VKRCTLCTPPNLALLLYIGHWTCITVDVEQQPQRPQICQFVLSGDMRYNTLIDLITYTVILQRNSLVLMQVNLRSSALTGIQFDPLLQ